MTARILHTLQLVLVNYFYRINAGFFTFIFFVAFGLPNSPLAFHYSLIIGIIHNQGFLLIVLLCWLLYNVKCIDYVVRQLQHPQNVFLFALNCLPYKKNYWYQLYIQFLVYLPALLYSIAIAVIAFKKHAYLCVTEVILFQLAVLLATPLLYVFVLQRRRAYRLVQIPSINLKMRKPLFLFPLFFLLTSRRQMLLITKVFSLLLVYGFITSYEPGRYDLRPLQLCLLLVAAGHCTIVFEAKVFEEDHLSFSKNLPLTIVGRFLRLTLMYAVLLVPEFIFLIKGLSLHFVVWDYPQLILMSTALLAIFHVALLTEKTNMEQFIRIVFGIVAGCFFIILYDPGIGLAAALLLLAFTLYNAYFFHKGKH